MRIDALRLQKAEVQRMGNRYPVGKFVVDQLSQWVGATKPKV